MSRRSQQLRSLGRHARVLTPVSTLPRRAARRALRSALSRLEDPYPPDFDAATIDLIERVGPYTMLSHERLVAIRDAVRYVVENDIPGAIVECGVWRGGSMMTAALTLLEHGETTRDLYLFDTFTGMVEPGAADVSHSGAAAVDRWQAMRNGEQSTWSVASLDGVRDAMQGTGYDATHIHLVAGRVEDTLPEAAPEQVSVLRLDTNWYASTRHELIHLYPRLSAGGVLLLDDYGHWQGARQAIDEYLSEQHEQILLGRTDYTGRMAVKQNGVPASGR
jgi:O-methyltransferase